MANHNRLVDYNRDLVTGVPSRFGTFLENLSVTSGVTYYPDRLKENLRTVPITYRDADFIYLAGAVKSGYILGFDLSGSIIQMPFSRSSIGRGIVNLKVINYAANMPILSDLYYKSIRQGIVVENTRTNYGAKTYSFAGNTTGLTVVTNTGMFGSSVGSFTWVEEGVGNSGNYGDIFNSASNGTYGVVAGWGSYNSIEFWLGLQDLSPTRCVRWHPNYNGQQNVIDFDRNYNIILDTLNRPDKDIKITKFDYQGKTYAKVVVDFKDTPMTSVGNMSFCIWDKTKSEPYPCISGSKFLVGNVRKNDLDQTLIISSTAATVSKQEDILTINLTQMSDIHIATSKGVYEFPAQPAGVFDYKSQGIIDCKIYSIAIKHK